jgi:hypothetical protein
LLLQLFEKLKIKFYRKKFKKNLKKFKKNFKNFKKKFIKFLADGWMGGLAKVDNVFGKKS